MSINYENFRHLPIADKIHLMEELWDDISASDVPVPLQAWYVEEARMRSEELDRHPEIALTREELWQRVKNS